ncbi:cilia- and flagella-associated protein 53-like [Lingula anatina]|uniref:Cilia- and flagella-associated protein 53 n=1 Tax=Lingula anatina TaxID=7574 RepID=A0A1S3HHY1_LINAN|nr:cilia- and flagella-associated protein 53-like [Lingula anatina]|eukprot:XP_013385627.1 cilia- and flagella-associated protein 53-like [Lingula anatina]
MMATQRQRRCREHTGPSPHSVAIVARPTNKRPPEHLILERRKKEEMREEALHQTKYNEFCDLKNDWERWTDRRIQINTVKRKVAGLMQAEQFGIEDRREKLRDLLMEEEQQYLKEMEEKEETVLERQAKMRGRAKDLREKREQERMQIVKEKLDQKFRNECEELRSTLSKRHQDEVCTERLEQLRIKERIEEEKKQEEAMYADLWHKDMLSKMEREEREAQAQHARNREVLGVIQLQRAALEAQKEEAIRLREEEARLLAQQNQLRKLEEQQALEEKRRQQQETREIYDRSVRMKMKRKAKEIQEELAFDMKILEQLLEESRNEAMEQEQRKKELREEDRRYREYLKQMLEEEKIRESEMERLIDEDVERMWQKRLAQWRLEKEARKKLLEEVLAVRRQQINEKLSINEKKQREALVEREEILRAIEENKQIELEQQERQRQKNLQYQSDLEGQMNYTQRQKHIESLEAQREYEKQLEAEMAYRHKLKAELDRPYVDKVHPMRKKTIITQNLG